MSQTDKHPSQGTAPIEKLFHRHSRGRFVVSIFMGKLLFRINRRGEEEEVKPCRSMAEANRLRQSLTDEGLVGIFEDAP